MRADFGAMADVRWFLTVLGTHAFSRWVLLLMGCFLASVAPSGAAAPNAIQLGLGTHPSISGDGRWVAFACENRNALCLVDTQTGNLEVLVTTDLATDLLQHVEISANGRVIAYRIRLSGGTRPPSQIWVYDRDLRAAELVSVDSTGAPVGAADYSEPAINDDGRYVVFGSSSDDLVVGDANGVFDVFRRDRQLGLTERMSVPDSGGEGDNASGVWGDPPTISGDGSLVAFASRAENLTPGDIADDQEPYRFDHADVFLRDHSANAIVRISEVPGTDLGGDQQSKRVAISADGRFAAFSTQSENLHEGPYGAPFSDWFVLLHDIGSDRHTLVNRPASGELEFDDSPTRWRMDLNRDGSLLYFVSSATNLVPGGADSSPDTYAWHDGEVTLIKPLLDGTPVRVVNPSTTAAGNVLVAEALVPPVPGTGPYPIVLIDRGDILPPAVSLFELIPTVVIPGDLLEVRAFISDVSRGDSLITAAQYQFAGGEWAPMTLVDGSADSAVEQFVEFVDTTGTALGEYEVCVRGLDAAGNRSAATCQAIAVVAGVASVDWILQCEHEPLWPQPGDTVRILAWAREPNALGDADAPYRIQFTEIWFQTSTGPVVAEPFGPPYESTFTTPPLEAGRFVYGCRARLGDTASFSGWRSVAVGPPSHDQAIPVAVTGPVENRIDLVFIADEDSYSGSEDPAFLEDVASLFVEGLNKNIFFNRYQHLINVWLARDTGAAFRESAAGDARRSITPPADWTVNYAFADSGILVHTDEFRDFARGGLFTVEPGDWRVLRHEAGHSPFGLSDEYCCSTTYFESRTLPNVYETLAACEADAPSLGRSASDCRDLESDVNGEVFYTSEPAGDDLMQNNTIPGVADRRRIEWKFNECEQGRC